MKKIAVLASVLLVAFSLFGCGNATSTDNDTDAAALAEARQTAADGFIAGFRDQSGLDMADWAVSNVEAPTNKFFYQSMARKLGVDDYLFAIGTTGIKKDAVAIFVYEKDGEQRVCICGTFDKNPQMQDAFNAALLLICKDATEADFEELLAQEIFFNNGKGGEIKGVTYDISVMTSEHTMFLDGPLANVKFAH